MSSSNTSFLRRPKPVQRATVWLLVRITVLAEVMLISTASKIRTLDARLAYSPSQALAILHSLTPESHDLYRRFNLADFAFIALYSALLVTWFRYLSQSAKDVGAHRSLIGLVPGCFDTVESIGVALLLRSPHPEHSPGLWLAVVGTPLKWLSTMCVLVLLLAGEIRHCRKQC